MNFVDDDEIPAVEKGIHLPAYRIAWKSNLTQIRSRLSRFRKSEKWFDKARFGDFCRRIGLRSDGVLRLVLVAYYALLRIA